SIYLFISDGYTASMKLNFLDAFYLFVLGTICTSLAYVAGVAVMKELSAFLVALVTNLEPVYGIILAFLFFGKREQMSLGFYAGALLVMCTIFLYPYIKKRTGSTRSKETLSQ